MLGATLVPPQSPICKSMNLDAYLLAFSLSAAYLEVGDTVRLLAVSKQLGSLGKSIHQINVPERVTWNEAASRAVRNRFPNIHGLSVARKTGKAAPYVLDLSSFGTLTALRLSGAARVVLAGVSRDTADTKDTVDAAHRASSGDRGGGLRELHLHDVLWTEADLFAPPPCATALSPLHSAAAYTYLSRT